MSISAGTPMNGAMAPSYSLSACHGGNLLAWATVSSAASRRRMQSRLPGKGMIAFHHPSTTTHQLPSPSFHSRSTRSSSLVALNALFLDQPMHQTTNAPGVVSSMSVASSPSTNLADWNPLQKDIAHWLTTTTTTTPATTTSSDNNNLSMEPSSTILLSSTESSSSSPDRQPTEEEIKQLQNAFGAFYGNSRDVPKAYELLSKCINIWEGTHQGGDEIAGLYRVRGDVNMELFQTKEAEADYAKAIQYLEGPDGDMADPSELPASRLGRARAVRSLGSFATPSQGLQASKDYEIYFNIISRLDVVVDDDDVTKSSSSSSSEKTSFSEAVVDGIQQNPYAAWEWGMVNRVAQNYDQAAEIHRLATNAFEEIGDKPRSVICALDRGLDLASGLGTTKSDGKKMELLAIKALEDAIESDVNVEGRDVELLQRVVAKEGEARIALSGVLWNSNQKGAAESQYGTACSRLDELNADYNGREADRVKKGQMPPRKPTGATLGFSIDDIVGAEEASCSRFKNEKFIEEKLVWDEGLQVKVKKFLTLSR